MVDELLSSAFYSYLSAPCSDSLPWVLAQKLKRQAWSGNVRELKSSAEAFALGLVEFDEATSLWRYDNSRHQNNFPKSTKLRKRVWVPPEHIRVVAWNEVEIASP